MPHRGADPEDDSDVDQGERGGQGAEDERLLDHDVELVEPVAEHRDATGHRDPEEDVDDQRGP